LKEVEALQAEKQQVRRSRIPDKGGRIHKKEEGAFPGMVSNWGFVLMLLKD
jgi:hypothetical protein